MQTKFPTFATGIPHHCNKQLSEIQAKYILANHKMQGVKENAKNDKNTLSRLTNDRKSYNPCQGAIFRKNRKKYAKLCV